MSIEFYPTQAAPASTTILAPQAPQSSVELVQGAKGDTRVTVKVYSDDPDEAARQATSLYDSLVARYAREAQP